MPLDFSGTGGTGQQTGLAIIDSLRNRAPGCGGWLGEVTGPFKAREGQPRRGIHCDSGLDTPHSNLKKLAQWLLFSQGVLDPLSRASWAQP